MRVRPLPMSWLIHTIDYEQVLEPDEYQKDTFSDPITVENVRVDLTRVYSRGMDGIVVVAEGVIFVDAANSIPFPKFKESSKIKFKGDDYMIKKVIPIYQPQTDALHHYEIEVV